MKPDECMKCHNLNPLEARSCLWCGAPIKLESVKEAVKEEMQLTELLREFEKLKRMMERR